MNNEETNEKEEIPAGGAAGVEEAEMEKEWKKIRELYEKYRTDILKKVRSSGRRVKLKVALYDESFVVQGEFWMWEVEPAFTFYIKAHPCLSYKELDETFEEALRWQKLDWKKRVEEDCQEEFPGWTFDEMLEWVREYEEELEMRRRDE